MTTLDAGPAAPDRVGRAPGSAVRPVDINPLSVAVDPAAARTVMAAELQARHGFRPGPVRDALLALPREVLMPQAYVRRNSPGEDPPRWDPLDWSAPQGRPELLGLLYGGAVCLPSTTGSRCWAGARDALGGVDYFDVDGNGLTAAC